MCMCALALAYLTRHCSQGDGDAVTSNVLADDSAKVVALLERLRVLALVAKTLTRFAMDAYL